MGIPIIPGPTFCNECSTCFAEDLTPEHVIVSASGISQGDWWDDSYPAPPNRGCVLHNVGGCRYIGGYDAPEHHISFVWQADESYLQISVGAMYLIFGATASPCSTFFTSDLTTHEWYFYGGHAVIMCARSFSVISESQHIAGLLGIQLDEHTKFDFWPISESRMCVRVARYMKGANLLMLIDRDAL